MKRFWKAVSVIVQDGEFRVALDGRPIRTQGGNAQAVPTRALAEALAGEWVEQGEEINPKGFALRDLVDYAIDQIARDRGDVIARLLPFAETDTLCYRAAPDEPLYRRQIELWEPVVTAAEKRHAITLVRVSGVVHRSQQSATLERLGDILRGFDALALAALETLASLSASLVVGLAALEEEAEAASLFAAANCEEDWQAELWGWDAKAQGLRALRFSEFQRAMEFARLARTTG